MNVRYLGALAVLFSCIGWLPAQPPTVPPPPLQDPTIPSTAPMLPAEALVPAAGGNIFYTELDYLLWKVRGSNLPQNVTAVPIGLIAVTATDTFINGVPPAATRTELVPISLLSQANFGGPAATEMGMLNGARLTAGLWTDPGHGFGIELSGFFLERGSDSRIVSSAASPSQSLLGTGVSNNVYVVVFGQAPSLVSTTPITLPRNTSSTVAVASFSTLWGAELNGRSTSLKYGSFDFGTLAGVRYIQFKDELTAFGTVNMTSIPGVTPQPPITDTLSNSLTFSTADRIRIWNNFIGAQAGIEGEGTFGNLLVYGRLKAAVGPTIQHAQLSGTTTVTNNDPARPLVPTSRFSQGGLLVGSGDGTDRTRTRFSFVPEVNLKIGYRFCNNFRVLVGYDGLYLGHMARAAGSTVNNTLATTISTSTGSASTNVVQPTFRFADNDTWVQGMSVGFELLF